MSQGDALRIMVEIKQVETYLARLRQVLKQAIKEESADVFTINAEIQTVTARGKRLVERYNEIARLQKEEREFLIAQARRDEQIALKRIRMQFKSHLPPRETEDA